MPGAVESKSIVMRVADYIMQRLAQASIRHLFMVTGRGVLYLSDAAAKCEELQCVSVHHEQSGAYAAMAYAQYNQTLGACLVSTGCASTNAITGALCAWQDEIPCIFVSGQNTLRETVRHTKLPIRTYGQQEADIVGIVSPITKYAVMIEDPTCIAYEMDKALHLAQSCRKGPVWIDVPLDIQNMRVDPELLARFKPEPVHFGANEKDVDSVYESLREAKRPVVLVGSGIRGAGAVEELRRFADSYCLPTVSAASAVDVYGAERPLSLGVVSTMAANRAANFAVQNADLVLVMGNRLTSMTIGNAPDKFARAAKVIVVDIDPVEHQKGIVNIDILIQADAKDFLDKLDTREPFETEASWQEQCRHWKAVFPKCEEERKKSDAVDLHYLADRLSEHLPNDAVLVCDSGLEELIIPTTVAFREGQRCLHPVSQGAMGYALPASIGAWLSSGKQTIVVTGDGSFTMNLQELQTIIHNNYPIKLLVVNNNCYAVIRSRQQDLFRTRIIGTDASNGISCPDFRKVADCFGIHYEHIETSTGLDEGLGRALQTPGPVICEIMALEEQGFLHSSFARNKMGRFVQRPLEDQSPYLDRELFLSEMVIEPIDQ